MQGITVFTAHEIWPHHLKTQEKTWAPSKNFCYIFEIKIKDFVETRNWYGKSLDQTAVFCTGTALQWLGRAKSPRLQSAASTKRCCGRTRYSFLAECYSEVQGLSSSDVFSRLYLGCAIKNEFLNRLAWARQWFKSSHRVNVIQNQGNQQASSDNFGSEPEHGIWHQGSQRYILHCALHFRTLEFQACSFAPDWLASLALDWQYLLSVGARCTPPRIRPGAWLTHFAFF